MKKRILPLLLAIMLCAFFTVTAYAALTADYFVVDDADLLSDSEESALAQRLEQLSSTYDAQIVVVTIDSIDGGDIDEFVEYLYDEEGMGYGENYDGVLLLVCMDPREYRILSNGYADVAINFNDIENIGDAIVSDLSDGNYVDAFNTFADECEYYLNAYINGYPFDAGMSLLISLAVGFVVALIVTGIWRLQLKSVKMQNQANVYVKPGSLQLTQSGDFFMYRNVTKTPRQQSSSSSGGSGSSRSVGGGSF